jgi:polysaccharide deacetylase family protein (PEP-CTERM system associated)
MTKNYLTFDIEDNFDPEELLVSSDWAKYEYQVVDNTKKILKILKEHQVSATFFVLGKVADRRPEIVPLIIEHGHCVASHGYSHKPVNLLGIDGFKEDLRKSKNCLEIQSHTIVKGFRAMGFSIHENEAHYLESVQEVGYKFDSSVLSSRFKVGNGFNSKPYALREVPVNSISIGRHHITLGGGIFFRLVPIFILEWIIARINKRGENFVIYLHAWEFNRNQPKRNVGFFQRIAQSPITFSSERKLRALLNKFYFGPI